MGDIDMLRREVAELRAKVAQLVDAHNADTVYLEKQHSAMHRMVRDAVWRFVMWLLPVPIPYYRRNVIVHLPPPGDRMPVMRGTEDVNPPIVRGV